ncbi:Cd2+/Zn2+-exporting ATPase [Bacillus iocasae]|uniref:Cd2+/Zn2+-exporting ATPase n=2 Tax=Priestia iocasae TaxID=2291674 RepID=A0ABS2QXV9_9BACI|nr:heavy metal translocating P-type ATPase [Metabacillus iocasae]MBM7704320.1 Cd2+/Zn2+-exporting ATPase [Metabacillus iocasae]
MEAKVSIKRQTKEKRQSSFLSNLVTHSELIAALTSGVLILMAWLLSTSDQGTLSVTFFVLAYVIGGFAKAKEGIEETIENKELNVEMLMIFAAIGAAIIGYWAEGAMLIFIFALSGALETYTMNKSNREITALMEMQPQEATRIINGNEEIVSVTDLRIGDQILVKPGERVPSDGTIVSGQTTIDQAAITGESVPVLKRIGMEVFAGTVNMKGAITVEITKTSEETLFQKIIQLVQSAQNEKSPSQLFIEKFEGLYVKLVLTFVALMMFLPHYVLGWSWTETFYRAMILLVVASPCALVASITPASLSAISNGARKGMLFKGGVHLERLAHLKAIAFDKTGTLTKGAPEVTDVIVRSSMSEDEFLVKIGSIERQSNHPLAQAIVHYVRGEKELQLVQPDSLEDVPGWGVIGSVGNQSWKIGKADFVGKELVEHFEDNVAAKLAEEGKTIVYAKDDEGIVGLIALKDIVREEAIAAIEQLKELGVYTIMLTGDSEKTAEAISKETHVNDYIAECLPENKVEHIKHLKTKYETVSMVGDGINDAPALATSHVGVAMGEGTDVALETADIVLMKNDLSRIAEAVKLSKRMNRIVKQNVIFSISVIVLLICSNFLQILDMPFGVIGHEGSTILVILNGLRLLK